MTQRTSKSELLRAVSARPIDRTTERAFRDVIDSLLSTTDVQSPETVIGAGDYIVVVDGTTGRPKKVKLSNVVGGWRDLKMIVSGSPRGVSAPTPTAFGPSGTAKQDAFSIGDSVYLVAHIEHDIKDGSTMYPHVHWTTNGTNTATVKWEISITACAGHNQANYPIDTVMTVEEAAHGTLWRSMITEHATGIDALEVDSLVVVTLKRITNGGTDNTDAVFANFMDFHHETQQYGTPSRSPDFYA